MKNALLLKHLEVHDSKKEKVEKCTVCEGVIRNRRELLEHRERHYVELNPLSCDVCGMREADVEGMRNHMTRIHSEKGRRKN